MIIKISTDFTDTPGARYYTDGEFSGQEFYEKVLCIKFKQCKDGKEKLTVDFDGCYGFAPSFLSESFGRLSDDFGKEYVLQNLCMISNQDPLIPIQVKNVIENPRRKNDEHSK